MSLLEDVFLEDEAGEAQELERVIEGDEFEERPPRSDSDENSEKEDEAEEEKKRVDPTSAKPKRVIKNPRFVLNPARLTGPRGIQVLPEHFKDFKFKGKGREREDLDLVLKKLEHWAYRLYPKFQFEDCLKKIETLGKKRPVMVHLHKIRNDQITSEETVVQRESSDEEPVLNPEPDEFDKLLQQQIDIARATPGPGTVKKTPFSERPSMVPKATSSPSINDEQRQRMLANRRMAEERRLARLKQNTSGNTSQDTAQNGVENSPTGENWVSKSPTKHDDNSISRNKNKSNVVDSSDEEDVIMNRSVDIHDSKKVIELDDNGKEVSKSSNKKNKVDSSDSEDETVSKKATIDIPENGIIELDDYGKEIQRRRTKKSNRDSSDEDLVLKRNVNTDIDTNQVIELDEYGKEVSKNTKKNNRPVIDSSDSDDDALVINDPITIEIEKNYNARKHNKSNVIDSSDEEEAIIMNESVSVDVHNSSNFDANINNDFDTIKNTRRGIVNEGNDIEIQTDAATSYVSEKNIRRNINTSSQENPVGNAIENVIAKTSEKELNNDIDYDVKVTQSDDLELMDVDFGDDLT